jgi:hypothetical protein
LFFIILPNHVVRAGQVKEETLGRRDTREKVPLSA